jgi:hypothetical protein
MLLCSSTNMRMLTRCSPRFVFPVCLIQMLYGTSLTALADNRGIERLERCMGIYSQHSIDSNYNIRRALPTDCGLKRWIRTTASHEYPGTARADIQVEGSVRRTEDGSAGRSWHDGLSRDQASNRCEGILATHTQNNQETRK